MATANTSSSNPRVENMGDVLDVLSPMATSNSPTRGAPQIPPGKTAGL